MPAGASIQECAGRTQLGRSPETSSRVQIKFILLQISITITKRSILVNIS